MMRSIGYRSLLLLAVAAAVSCESADGEWDMFDSGSGAVSLTAGVGTPDGLRPDEPVSVQVPDTLSATVPTLATATLSFDVAGGGEELCFYEGEGQAELVLADCTTGGAGSVFRAKGIDLAIDDLDEDLAQALGVRAGDLLVSAHLAQGSGLVSADGGGTAGPQGAKGSARGSQSASDGQANAAPVGWAGIRALEAGRAAHQAGLAVAHEDAARSGPSKKVARLEDDGVLAGAAYDLAGTAHDDVTFGYGYSLDNQQVQLKIGGTGLPTGFGARLSRSFARVGRSLSSLGGAGWTNWNSLGILRNRDFEYFAVNTGFGGSSGTAIPGGSLNVIPLTFDEEKEVKFKGATLTLGQLSAGLKAGNYDGDDAKEAEDKIAEELNPGGGPVPLIPDNEMEEAYTDGTLNYTPLAHGWHFSYPGQGTYAVIVGVAFDQSINKWRSLKATLTFDLSDRNHITATLATEDLGEWGTTDKHFIRVPVEGASGGATKTLTPKGDPTGNSNQVVYAMTTPEGITELMVAPYVENQTIEDPIPNWGRIWGEGSWSGEGGRREYSEAGGWIVSGGPSTRTEATSGGMENWNTEFRYAEVGKTDTYTETLQTDVSAWNNASHVVWFQTPDLMTRWMENIRQDENLISLSLSADKLVNKSEPFHVEYGYGRTKSMSNNFSEGTGGNVAILTNSYLGIILLQAQFSQEGNSTTTECDTRWGYGCDCNPVMIYGRDAVNGDYGRILHTNHEHGGGHYSFIKSGTGPWETVNLQASYDSDACNRNVSHSYEEIKTEFVSPVGKHDIDDDCKDLFLSSRDDDVVYLPDGEVGCYDPLEHPNGGPQQCYVPQTANPINLASGNKYYVENDFVGTGVFPLNFTRFYNSKINNIGGEKSWSNSYTQRLTFLDGRVGVHRTEGKVVSFKPDGNNWVPSLALGSRIQLEQTQQGWEVILPDGTKEKYDSNGALLEIVNLHGITHTLSYNGKVVTVTHSNGQTLTLEYEYSNDYVNNGMNINQGFRNIIKVTDPTGEITTFEYHPTLPQLITKVTYPAKPGDPVEFKEYHYGDPNFSHLITSVTDSENKPVSQVSYDLSGRAVSSLNAYGKGDTVEYGNGSTKLTNSLGKVTTFYFENVSGFNRLVRVEGDASANCAAANREYDYDSNGYLTHIADWKGNITKLTNNSRGLAESVTEAFGTDKERTTVIEWHPDYHLPEKIIKPGKETVYSYGSPLMSVVTITAKDTSTSETRVKTLTYEDGYIKTIDGPRTDVNDVVTYGYESHHLKTIEDAKGHITRITQRDAAGRILETIDPNDVTMSITYDARGRVKTVTTAGDTFTYFFNSRGLLAATLTEEGVYTSFEFDDARRLKAVQDAFSNRIEYIFDDAGNVTNTIIKDSSETITFTHDQRFDELNRKIKDIDSLTNTASYSYDANGNVEEIQDAKANPPTVNHYDELNRLYKITDSLGHETIVGINALNQIESVKDPRQNTTLYSSNAFNDITLLASPDTGVTSHGEIDKAGNVKTKTDSRGIVTTYGYDEMNRLTSVSYPDSGLNKTFVYDTAVNGKGRLHTMDDASGITTYSYNSKGRVSNVNWRGGAASVDVAYDYDASGNLVFVTYPSGNKVHYEYNSVGRVEKVSLVIDGETEVLVDNITYEPFGPLKSMNFMNGLNLTETHDADYRIDTMTVSGAVLNRDYNYDANGNVEDIIDLSNDSLTQNFTYDELNRLKTTDGIYGNQVYDYDESGNRISTDFNGNSDIHIYDPEDNRLDAITGTNPKSFSYDDRGNILTENEATFTWGDSNRLLAVDNGSTTTYTYNGWGQRVMKTTAGVTTYFVYNQSGRLVSELDSSGSVIQEYVWLGSKPVALVKPKPGSAPASGPSASPLMSGEESGEELTRSSASPLMSTEWLTHEWKQFRFDATVANPVVLAGVPTFNGGNEGVIRLQNVTDTQVEASFTEWGYLDGYHITEGISLMALPEGRHTMGDGSIWEVGSFGHGGTMDWKTHPFSESFPAAPKVFVTLQTSIGSDPVTVRIKAVNADGFDIALWEEEARNNGHVVEKVGYVAIYSPANGGTAEINGAVFDYTLTTASIDHNFKYVGDQQMKLEEERSASSETNHVFEDVDVLSVEGHTFAQISTFNGGNTVALRRIGETPGNVFKLDNVMMSSEELTHVWKQMSISKSINRPVVLAGVPTFNGGNEGVIRLQNVTDTQVEASFTEWGYLDGWHTTEGISLMALPEGRHTTGDGSIWEVGSFGHGGTMDWKTHSFSESFPAAPKVFVTLQTSIDSDPVTVRIKAVNADGFDIALWEEQARNDGHAVEKVGYVAIYSPANGGTAEINGAVFDYTLTTASIDHNFKYVHGDQKMKLEEERSADSETNHLFEDVDVLSVEGHTFAQISTFNGGDTVALRRIGGTPAVEISDQDDDESQREIFIYHTDHLNSPQVLTDENGSIVWQASYSPYGEATILTEMVFNPLRFPGQYFDAETGLHYNWHRYYNPETGRYISSDPIGLKGGINTYAYAENNPMNRVDPLGTTSMQNGYQCIGICHGNTYPTTSGSNIVTLVRALLGAPVSVEVPNLWNPVNYFEFKRGEAAGGVHGLYDTTIGNPGIANTSGRVSDALDMARTVESLPSSVVDGAADVITQGGGSCKLGSTEVTVQVRAKIRPPAYNLGYASGYAQGVVGGTAVSFSPLGRVKLFFGGVNGDFKAIAEHLVQSGLGQRARESALYSMGVMF